MKPEFFPPVNFQWVGDVGAGLAINLAAIQRLTTKPAPTDLANQQKFTGEIFWRDARRSRASRQKIRVLFDLGFHQSTF